MPQVKAAIYWWYGFAAREGTRTWKTTARCMGATIQLHQRYTVYVVVAPHLQLHAGHRIPSKTALSERDTVEGFQKEGRTPYKDSYRYPNSTAAVVYVVVYCIATCVQAKQRCRKIVSTGSPFGRHDKNPARYQREITYRMGATASAVLGRVNC